MRSMSAALLAFLLLASPALAGPNYAPGSLDPYFTIDWQTSSGARGLVLEGYVHSRANIFADRMRLGIDLIDASGKVGHLLSGKAGAPADTRLRILASEHGALFVEVEDDTLSAGDRLEVWVGAEVPAWATSCIDP